MEARAHWLQAGWKAAAEPGPKATHRQAARVCGRAMSSFPSFCGRTEGKGSPGECTGRATFHLQPVEHGAAVHHIQHRSAGLQAGEHLEDKGGQAQEGPQGRAACGACTEPVSASRIHSPRPSTSTSRTFPSPRSLATPDARPEERAPALSIGRAQALVTAPPPRPRPRTTRGGAVAPAPGSAFGWPIPHGTGGAVLLCHPTILTELEVFSWGLEPGAPSIFVTSAFYYKACPGAPRSCQSGSFSLKSCLGAGGGGKGVVFSGRGAAVCSGDRPWRW